MKIFSLFLVAFLLCVQLVHAQQKKSFIIQLRAGINVAEFCTQEGARAVFKQELFEKKNNDVVQLSPVAKQVSERLQRYVVIIVGQDSVVETFEKFWKDSRVEHIQENGIVRLDEDPVIQNPVYASQYALRTVQAEKSWGIAKGKGVLVGVIDTGIDWEHPDLKKSLAAITAEDLNKNGTFEPWYVSELRDGVSGDLNGIDDDNNGFIDDVIGYDVVDQAFSNIGDDKVPDAIPFDEQGHGTSVSGVIAGTPGSFEGMWGLAPESKVITIRAFDATGNAEEDDIAMAIVYAAKRGAQVLNMSFGDGVDSPIMRDAVAYAHELNCLLIASSGNTGGVSQQFPASYSQVMAVGATTATDNRAVFSSTGSIVSVTAPGDRIITTAVGGKYRTVSGTSFAAPYVAAAAALLLERTPMLQAAELRGILEESSIDLGAKGWDIEYGAGRLDAYQALVQSFPTVISIENIQAHDELYNTIVLPVFGTVLTPLFDTYVLMIGTGTEPTEWDTIIQSNLQVRSKQLANTSLQSFLPGMAVLRLQAILKNGRTLESRRRISVVDTSALQVLSYNVEQPWLDTRKTVCVTLEATKPVYASVVVRQDSSQEFVVSDVQRLSRRHTLYVTQSIPGRRTQLTIRCISKQGDTVLQPIEEFVTHSQAAPGNGMQVLPVTAPAAYLCNQLGSVYNSDTNTVIVNLLRNGEFGQLATFEIQTNGTWVRKDSASAVWIPRGIGDINNNGIPEILGHSVGSFVVYEAEKKGGNPFSRMVFSDLTTRRNGAAVADVTNDGIPEFLTLTDGGCIVFSYKDGLYQNIGFIANPSPGLPGALGNRVDEISIATGDFDNDGNTEIAFSDTDGDLVIAESKNGSFSIEKVFEFIGIGGSGYTCKADVDGDGTPEIVLGVPDSTEADTQREYGRNLWTYRIIRSTTSNQYDVAATETFAGVRYGIGYSNGLSAGPINSTPGDEIAICVFPKLYVFTWDTLDKKLKPIWYREAVTSSRFLFENITNATNTIWFGETVPEYGLATATRAAQWNSRAPLVALDLRARLVDSAVTEFTWAGNPEYSYELFIRSGTGSFNLETTLSGNVYRTSALSTTDLQRAFVRIAAAPAPIVGITSDTIELPRYTIRKPILAKQHGSVTSAVDVEYSGAIGTQPVEPTQYTLLQNGVVIANAVSVLPISQNTVVCSFGVLQIPDGIYQIECLPILDDIGGKTLRAVLQFQMQRNKPVAEMILSKLSNVNDQSIEVEFSEDVSPSTLTEQNFSLLPSGSIRNVTSTSSRTVKLEFDPTNKPTARGVTYSVTASEVVSVSGTPITKGIGNTLSFVLSNNETEHVFVYPQPASLSEVSEITIGGLPANAVVEIIDQRFKVIATLNETDGNGGTIWNLFTNTNQKVPPGLYYYRVTNATNNADVTMQKILLRR